MFKSVFTKYVLTFMIIIGISFITLATIISAMVTNYSINTKQDLMKKAVYIAGINIMNSYELYSRFNYSTFDNYVRRDNTVISNILTTYAEIPESSVIFITDTAGNLLATNDIPNGYIQSNLPATYLERLFEGQDPPNYSNLDGMFAERHVIYAIKITSSASGVPLGAIFICSATTTISSFVNSMMRIIILSCLWILLASMVAVYYISDKIIVRPLKLMSTAAKQFSAGSFDVRIPVSGQDEVAELAGAFNNMAATLAKNEELRRMFLSNVSHDLRTPMTTIAGFTEGIIDGTIPAEEHAHYLDIIAKEIRRLARLVNTLLDITRMQAGETKFNPVTFDICEMCRIILISLEQRIDEKKVDVTFDTDEDKMQVHADNDAIYRVLYNLCENAVKFVSEGGALRLRVFYKDKKVVVSVYNTGQGIAAQDIPYVFDRFFKADSSRGLDKTGVGLGLFISKTIIDSHKEQIKVKSAEGEWCEFVFTLPAVNKPM